jgi:hypothetical protein
MKGQRTFDLKEMQAAFDRAAHKAVHGTREERSGRFKPPPRTIDLLCEQSIFSRESGFQGMEISFYAQPTQFVWVGNPAIRPDWYQRGVSLWFWEFDQAIETRKWR